MASNGRRPGSSADPARPATSPGIQNIPSINLERVRTSYFDGDGQQTARRPPPPMRIRRLTSNSSLRSTEASPNLPTLEPTDSQTEQAGRRRSFSAPQRPQRLRTATLETTDLRRPLTQLQTLSEESPTAGPHAQEQAGEREEEEEQEQPDEKAANDPNRNHLSVPLSSRRRSRAASDAATSAASFVMGRSRRNTTASRFTTNSHEYETDVVDLLDVIDPEVSTLSTLNNVQNSLFIPNLGRFLNRQPTYDLSRAGATLSRIETASDTAEADIQQRPKAESRASTHPSIFGPPLARSHSITSTLSESNFAVLPHGIILEGWSEEDKAELNDHVRYLLHSRKEGFKRSMKAFGKYIRTPLGFFVTTYAFLITFWGAAWVLFIIGWLSAGGRQQYFIMICDQVLTALFCVVGIGLSPFRAVDTYHMQYVARYHYKTLRLRRQRNLPPLEDENDLPEPGRKSNDLEAGISGGGAGEDRKSDMFQTEETEMLLTPEEQRKFEYHRAKFCKSHTFYKPHETFTHRAFGIDLLITAVVLLDFHSIFQMVLGGTTWGISYHVRPNALTAVILTCSICCNISAGLVISIGGKKTRKKEVVETLFRQALTEQALDKIERKKGIKGTKTDDLQAQIANSREEARLALEGRSSWSQNDGE